MFRFLVSVRFLAAVVVSAALASCGGGGGGDDASGPTIAVTYDITNFNVGVPAGGNVFVPVTATLSPRPDGTVYAYVVADKAVLKTGATSVTRNANGSYTAVLQIDPALAAGKYTGSLTLRLCKDSACAQEYALSGATLPYAIDVETALAVEVTANGVPVSLTNGFYYAVRAGDTVVITSNIPTVWGAPTRVSGGAAGSLNAVSQTSSSWTATVSGTLSMFELRATSAHYGSNSKLVYLSIQ